jgi:hypothetical protein
MYMIESVRLMSPLMLKITSLMTPANNSIGRASKALNTY